MKRYQRGFVLKLVSWTMGLVIFALAAIFGINATDEALSEEAKAAMNIAPPPAPSDENGFLDFLGLGAADDAPTREVALKRLAAYNAPDGSSPPDLPASIFPGVRVRDDKRLPRCRPEETSCLDAAVAHPQLRDVIDSHRVFLGRYRAMRAKPQFVDLTQQTSPLSPIPAYVELFGGHHLSLLGAAVAFNSRDRAGAIRELELEGAFHRKVFNQGRTLITKMVAVSILDRHAIFAAEIARRLPRSERPLWFRLEAIVHAHTRDELDVVAPLKLDRAYTIRWMVTRRYVRLSDDHYRTYSDILGRGMSRPWWDPVAPYLYRPHQTVNRYAAQSNLLLRVAEAPSSDFFKAVVLARERAHALTPGAVSGAILNPVGRDHPLITVVPLQNAANNEDDSITPYIGRMHSHRGLLSLVLLQVKLRAAGISEPRAVAAALAGPIGMAHPDPFTGKPMRLDEKTGTIGFDAPEALVSYAVRQLIAKYGRVAIPL